MTNAIIIYAEPPRFDRGRYESRVAAVEETRTDRRVIRGGMVQEDTRNAALQAIDALAADMSARYGVDPVYVDGDWARD